jgi:hypothetical protein
MLAQVEPTFLLGGAGVGQGAADPVLGQGGPGHRRDPGPHTAPLLVGAARPHARLTVGGLHATATPTPGPGPGAGTGVVVGHRGCAWVHDDAGLDREGRVGRWRAAATTTWVEHERGGRNKTACGL